MMPQIVRRVILWTAIIVCNAAWGQPHDEMSLRPYDSRYEEEDLPELKVDSLLFYRAVQQSRDLWAEVADSRFTAVAFRRRGEERSFAPVALEGVEVSWNHTPLLRRMQASERYESAMHPDAGMLAVGSGVHTWSLTESDPVPGGAVALRTATRSYRYGAEGVLSVDLPHGWHLTAMAEGRGGNDLQIDGVYTRRMTAAMRLGCRTARNGHWELLLALPWQERGERSASVEEAYRLRGSTGYNPAWGRQNGVVRNSRVRREAVPLTMLVHTWQRGISRWRATVACETGIRSRSALAWFGASTPRPDNYHYLPSYFTGTAFDAVDAAWRTGDERYTQIDWAELYRRNRMQPDGEALYALEERIERPLRIQFAAGGVSEIGGRLTLSWAVRIDYEGVRSYKEMADLLGADHLTDIDHFLIDDATYANLLQNDLRHPDRQIRVGDRFGYDYRMTHGEAVAEVALRYRSDRWSALFGGSVGHAIVQRYGYYEKELFPGNGSRGPSRRSDFTPTVLRGGAGYVFSPRDYLEAGVHYVASAPEAEHLFFQPLYCNRMLDLPVEIRRYGAEAAYHRTGDKLQLRVSGYFTATRNGVQTSRFYDDLSRTYCDMVVRGIGRHDYGLEAAARLRLDWDWSLTAALGWGNHIYATNPDVELYADADHSPVMTRSRSYVSGLHPGGTAAIAATAGVHYFGRRGWYCSLDGAFVGGRWVDPSFHYRTSRVANQASDTPETFARFTRQEAIGDSFTVDLSAGRIWRIGRKERGAANRYDTPRLAVTLTVRNLLDERHTLYSAYESDRIRRFSDGATTRYRPFATTLLYAYGRSAVCTVSYKF